MLLTYRTNVEISLRIFQHFRRHTLSDDYLHESGFSIGQANDRNS